MSEMNNEDFMYMAFGLLFTLIACVVSNIATGAAGFFTYIILVVVFGFVIAQRGKV